MYEQSHWLHQEKRFQLAGVVVNDSKTREAISRDQMRKFLKFIHDDNNYCKYYKAL